MLQSVWLYCDIMSTLKASRLLLLAADFLNMRCKRKCQCCAQVASDPATPPPRGMQPADDEVLPELFLSETLDTLP